MPPNKQNPYEDRMWDLVLDEIKSLRKDVSDIKARVNWVYGAAAVVTIVANLAWFFIREKIQKLWH